MAFINNYCLIYCIKYEGPVPLMLLNYGKVDWLCKVYQSHVRSCTCVAFGLLMVIYNRSSVCMSM